MFYYLQQSIVAALQRKDSNKIPIFAILYCNIRQGRLVIANAHIWIISMQWFLYMNGRNCWKGKGNQHILLNNKQLVYRHNKAILGQNERFIKKIEIAILTASFTEGWGGGGGGEFGRPQPLFPPNWSISRKHYLNQVKVLGKRGVYIGVSKNLIDF